MKANFKKVWGIPILLAAVTFTGLLTALLGTRFWYPFAWVAMIAPIVMIAWKIRQPSAK